jgi:hypothetical protein
MILRIAAAIALVLLAAVLWRGASVSTPSAAALPEPAGKGRAASPGPITEAKGVARDPFRYADARPVLHEAAPQAQMPVAAPLAPVPAPESPIRLSGFARRSGVLKAVLSLSGSVAVVGPGETIEGYRVLSVDEERGVRLQQPDGTEITLLPSDR